MGIAGSVRKKGIVLPAKTGVVAVVAFQRWETGHGMFDHPADLAGDDQPDDRRLGRSRHQE